MRGAIITMEAFENRKSGSVGSSRIRGDWLVKYWKDLEPYRVGVKYDFVIYQKAYWKTHAEKFEGLKFFDICDPDWLEPRPVVEMIEKCHGVVTSSQALAEQIRKFDVGGKPVICIPDRVDLEWSHPYKERHEGKLQRAVWFGYASGFPTLEQAVPALKKRGIKLTVISEQYCQFADEWLKFTEDTVNERIIMNDIVVFPPHPSDNYRLQFKSNNKTVQSWALKMPVATSGDDLDRFMTAEARQREADEKYALVKEKYDAVISAREWAEFVKSIASSVKIA